MGLLKKIISWFIPEQKQAKQQTGTNLTKASSDDHIKIIYGTRETKGTIVFMNVTNPDDGDDIKNDLLHMVIVWCEGGIESIDDLLLNGISINDSKFNAKDGGRWAYAHHFENGMAGFGTSHLRAAGFDPINKGHRLDGLACSYIRLEWTTGEDAPFTGIPDVTAIIKGRKVKNLETGVVEYSENPAYCTLDYLTHPIVSKKLTETEYDLESFKVSGRICDTQVPTYQGSSQSKPLFTCNAIIDTAQSVLENTELLSKSMRALMPIINGKLTLIIEQDDAPTPFGLSEKEFLGTLKYDEGSKNKRYNRVIVEYIDKELKFSEQDAVYPEPESALANQWLAEDNGVLLEYRFKVSSCTDYYEARQMARIIAMLSREALSFDTKVAPIGLRYTVGDVVPISHKKLGWENKPFRIIDKTDLPDGTFNFSFREHQPYIYNWLSGEVRPPIPDTSLPDPRNITAPTNFSSELLNDGHVSIKWESEYSYFDIQIYKDNALILSTSSISNEFVITALDAGNYEMDVRAASKIGFRSAWVSFGFNVELPAAPAVNVDAVTYNTITLSASVAGASLGTTFEWQFLGKTDEPISSPNTAAGYNYIYTGLVPDTEYSFKVRTKNLSGVSPWVDVAVKTSLSDLLDYIDDIPLEKLSEDAQTLIEDINAQVDRLRPETENNLPSLIAQNIDAITGLNSKVEVLDAENPNSIPFQIDQLVDIVDVIHAENPNNLQQQLADSNSKITDLERVTEVLDSEDPNGVPARIEGLSEIVEVINAENPNNLQSQLANSNSKITDLERVTEVLDETKQDSLPALIKINNIAIEQQRLAQQNLGLSLLNVTSAHTNWRNEYERRTLNNERLIDAAVYVDPDTGTIVNRAYAIAKESFNSATLLIEGVNSKITLASQQIAQSQNRISQAEAQLIVQAAQINQKVTFAEVEGQIAGALSAIQPAYNWQFNTGVEGFNPDSHNALGYIVATAQISSPAISYNADENPMFRLRVRKHAGTTWKGDVKFNGGATTLHLPEPAGSDFETLTLDAAGTEGYTGTITSLEFDLGPCDIDFIEVGKRGANDLALADITARTTELEQDINAATGIMAQYATTNWVNALGYQTQSNVQTLIDSFNTQYSIAATLQEFNDQDIIVKANAAQTWIDGANATIRDQVTRILNSEDGVNQRISTAEQNIDAIAGEISQGITQVSGLEIDVQGLGLNEVIAAYNKMQQDKELAEQSFSLATANQKLTAVTNDVESLATQTLELAGLYGQNAAFLTSLNQAFANERTARSSSERELRAEITREGTRAVAQANERLEAVVGYCVDAEGNKVDEVDAIACIANGHEWVDGPLVQLINDYTTVFVNEKGYQTASNVQQYISTFDGEYGITATIQQINDEGIITAAKEAQQWINAAEGTITNLITQFVTQPDGINDSLAFAHEQIQANADDIQSGATARQQLSVRMENAESDLTTLDEAIVTEQQARASMGSELRIEFQNEDLAMLATANEYTRATSGYCVDVNGDVVDEEDAVVCEAAGHTWVNLPSVTKAVELSSAYVDDKGYQTQSNVNQLIDTFNSAYGITTTIQEINDQDIIVKANAAKTWIDGANATIRDQVTSILNSEDGVNERISVAEQSIDAISGEISQSITQVNGLEIDVRGLGLNEVIAAYNKMQQDKELAEQSVSLATANQKITAVTNDVESLATQTLELAGLYGQNAAFLTSLNQAFANERTARSSSERELRAEITREGTRAVAQANERLEAVVGYCVDAEGNKVDEPDAMACIAAGHEWVDGPLVQLINDYTSVFVDEKGYQTAANVQQFISTFDGEYGITATIQQINNEGVITAAKEAQQWINAAEGTITNLITQFVTQPDGINDSLAFAHEQIQANADDISSEATARQQLSVRMGEAESDLVSLDEAIVNEQQARASQGSQLRVEFQAQDIAILATANEYTRATTGYCVDATGEIVDEEDAIACEAAGHTWVDGPAVQRAINLSAAYVDEKGYQTQSNVNQLLDTFNATYQISATLQEFNDNNTLQKANNAQQFINAAEGYIAERITLFNASEGGVDAKFSDVQQRLDAAEGAVTTSILQIQGLEFGQQAQGLNDVIAAYNQFKQDHDLAKQNVKVALANEKLQAQTTDIESLAQQQLELAAIFNNNNSIITSLDKAIANQYKSSVVRDQRYQATFEDVTARFSDVTTALATIDEANTLRDIEFESFVADTIASFDEVSETFASQNQAFSTLQQTLTSKIENDTEAAIATAQEYTRTAVGYCVNAEGQITSENDAVQCVTDGGSWVDGPLAEYISNLQISDGESTASIKELKQVFKKVNGELVVRGGWQLDNNGRAVGETGNLDLVADVIRHGVMVGENFVPTIYVDNTDPANPVQTVRGRMVLGDGYAVDSVNDIRAQDGKDGKDGQNGQNGQDGARGSVQIEVATSTGAWYDSTANNSLPSAPVIHDRVTIYKASDPAVQTTKRYTGSSWQSYVLHVHGSALIEDTLDGKVLRAGTRIESPRIDLIGNNFMKIELASGFGPEQLWYWYGPKLMKNGLPDLDQCTRANATEWKDVNGNSFTKGTFIAGALESSVSTSQQVNNPSRELEFTSNGNTIYFAVSYQYRRTYFGPNNGDPMSVYCPSTPIFQPVSGTLYLERWNGSSWVVVASNSITGNYSCTNGFYESEPGTPNLPYIATTSSQRSFTYNHTPGSGYQKYRVRAAVNNFISGAQVGQYLSLAVSE